MVRQLCAALIWGSIILTGCATDAALRESARIPAPADNPRLQHAMAKLRRGETVSVAVLGGSITAGHQAKPPASAGWAGLVARWWREKAAETGGKIEYHNAGASGTDSAFGAVRVRDQVLVYEPDVVFVEFAINDQWLNSRVRRRSYEGILRQLLAGSSRSVILLALNEKARPDKSAGADEERIGDHYGLPTLVWADWVKLSAWDLYFTGGETIHPNNEGHAGIAAGITAYLDAVWDSLPPDGAIPSVDPGLPEALVSGEFQNITLIGGNDTEALAVPLESTGWQAQKAILPDEWINSGKGLLTGWTTDKPDADLPIRVRGKSVGVLFTESDQYRNGLAWIEDPDGTEKPKVTINAYVSYRTGYYGYAYAEIADNLDPAKEYILHLAVNTGGRQNAPANVIGVVCTNL
ncbi:MAG: SGNH/GDSL hydrolase family protein [Treponema sp.]|nr:SGNH/GDSL hydrolase family protein [Treponema sp.]